MEDVPLEMQVPIRQSLNITDADLATVEQVHRLLTATLAVPAGLLEHLVQVAHESGEEDMTAPPELFMAQGVTCQCLRMFWLFRSRLEAAMLGQEPTRQ